ncbi:MAG TPA: hypothetical protein PLB89_04960 [Flavobacteriales bacterium]|nr:hypothetical protein [Flavobacteriales bacterium]
MSIITTIHLQNQGVYVKVHVRLMAVGVPVGGFCDFDYRMRCDDVVHTGTLSRQWVPTPVDELRVLATLLKQLFPFTAATAYRNTPRLPQYVPEVKEMRREIQEAFEKRGGVQW